LRYDAGRGYLQGLQEGLGPYGHQSFSKFAGGFHRGNRQAVPQIYRTGVKAAGNAEGADSGFDGPPNNRPVDRGRAAQGRQQGEMKVDGPQRRQSQDFIGQQ
jgi:hypothetical protein